MTIRNASSMPPQPDDWQARGYHGQGNVRDLIGTLAGRSVMICGNGGGVFEEYEAAAAALTDPLVFACNDVGQYLPIVHHWVSLHTDNLAAWKAVRALHCRSMVPTKYHGVDPRPHVDYMWDRLTPCFALSGYFAMQIAWIMGAERIVLCGCPGIQTRRFFEAKAREDFGYGEPMPRGDHGIRNQLQSEMERVPGFKLAVRSMSGWTQSYFGPIETIL